ncbi:hypothetical protein K493DRAFT_319092 [Basidiobolus meristosporus CBS 931.73]|uniref:Uncharacterized protein n=1 Tax=Basidiobolus meristosporus CBS 931.73 TaxID=1314790 RepID=A0A1Y1XT55_9FUNG|nr:hypothetical protein K493DRAFT_319092 [Basidiobolus meristosporus CBS 931.73]|eukprot:ORX88932.1 hypothetical protein K493DRAFT_319092 [Basidiobolus meristosporus CBS 931.73]
MFIHKQSAISVGTNYWVKQIRRLFLANGSVSLDVVVTSYRTHQNLLALARTCQTFGLYSIGIAIVNSALSRYCEIRGESDLSTCPTVKEL